MSITTYYLLSDLNINVRIRINSLKGKKPADDLELRSALDYSPITSSKDAELYVTCSLYSKSQPLGHVQCTSYRAFPTDHIKWNEWLSFPVKYRDLPPTSRLVVTVWEISSTSKLLSPLADDEELHPTSTASSSSGVGKSLWNVHGGTQQPRPLGGSTMPLFNKKGLLKLGRRKLYLWQGTEGDGGVPSNTPYKTGKTESLDRLEKLVLAYDQKEWPRVEWLDKLTLRRMEKLLLTKSHANYVPQEMYLTVEFPAFKHSVVYTQKPCNPALPEILPLKEPDRIFVLHDPEMTRESPVENKYYKLEKSAKGISERDLRPNINDKKKIDELISSPSKHLSNTDKELLWRYRFALIDNKRALTKFLRCVDFEDFTEAKEAVELVKSWVPIDTEQALELLSKSFTNPEIRKYAVQQLQKADDDELSSYLLQLVQALRYEDSYPSPLSEFLKSRATQSFEVANFLHWFLAVEEEDKQMGTRFKQFHEAVTLALEASSDEKAREWATQIAGEKLLVEKLVSLAAKISAKGGKVEQKRERLRQLLEDGGEMADLQHFHHAVRLPVRPEQLVLGVISKESTLFKSALAPMLVSFATPPSSTARSYKVIFKSGDDLRQDQLMIQMINLMDSLLKKWNFNLRLTPYRVLATSTTTGFVEYVPDSRTLTSILEEYNHDIKKYLQQHNPKPQNLAKAVETFVKSCAGYCVITYILGIGDRHLDNVLMTSDGHLFHIDFGWIFGRDPKPFPPPMKFCKEMVEAMGGADSIHYRDFRKYCCVGFNILRKHSALILNLLSLMGDANIPHLMDDVEKNLAKVQEKFRLDLNDREAESFILSLVDESVSALFPQLVERMHKWALYWR